MWLWLALFLRLSYSENSQACISQQPVLLLRGSRYPIDDGQFQSFGRTVFVRENTGEQLESHEAKTGLHVWDAVN
jgi:hypothetical protein